MRATFPKLWSIWPFDAPFCANMHWGYCISNNFAFYFTFHHVSIKNPNWLFRLDVKIIKLHVNISNRTKLRISEREKLQLLNVFCSTTYQFIRRFWQFVSSWDLDKNIATGVTGYWSLSVNVTWPSRVCLLWLISTEASDAFWSMEMAGVVYSIQDAGWQFLIRYGKVPL